MEQYTKKDMEKAGKTIASMISRSEKVQFKLKEGSPQASLTRNRLMALRIASDLVARELSGEALRENFSREELEKAVAPITSTIKKCEKVIENVKEGSSQETLTRNMIEALYMSLAFITEELKK